MSKDDSMDGEKSLRGEGSWVKLHLCMRQTEKERLNLSYKNISISIVHFSVNFVICFIFIARLNHYVLLQCWHLNKGMKETCMSTFINFFFDCTYWRINKQNLVSHKFYHFIFNYVLK